MPIQKQNISISFGQGLDTKTDPNQVMPGKLITLQNTVFNTAMELQKRNGYMLLGALPAGENLGNFKSELVGFSGTRLFSYSPSTQSVINKGSIVSTDLSTQSVYRSATQQTEQDSAFHSSGLYLYVWNDSTNGYQYQVVSSNTGNQVITATNLPANSVNARAWSVGNFLIITYINTSTNTIRYISIPVYTLVAASPVDISTQMNTSNRVYDGVVANNALYIVFNGSDVGGAIRSTYLDANLNLHSVVAKATETATTCLGVFADNVASKIWITYYNGTSVRYFILNQSSLTTFLAPTTVATSSNILNVNGYASNGTGAVFYQTQNTYSYNSVRTDFISTVSLTSGGTVGSASVFLRGVGLTSKVFAYNSNNYMVVNFSEHIQPTYFVVDTSGNINTKLAYSNAGGYSVSGALTNVNTIASGEFQFAYLFKDLLKTQSGQVFTQTGVNTAILLFSGNELYLSQEAGNNLNVSGGCLWAYDGYGPVEQNFHLFPENLGITATTASVGTIPANTYSYVSLYEWTDNQGNIHRSGYAPSTGITISGPSSGITVNIPTLRLTAKQNTRSPVSVTLYRTAPTVATGIFYKVSSITSPTFNSVTTDSVAITDNNTDAQIVGNELLYTTGGVVQDTGGQACIGATLFKNRLFTIDAQNRLQLNYSKQILPSTPVEMSDEFTFNIDPRFGDAAALSVMDDKLIIFKPNALFYLTGNGPDNTGANNDFTEAVFISSVVGSSNPKSIVLTQDGLMFQSNKGIWLLDRSLGVSYIGAPVEDFNGNTITSAVLVPNTTQVRFTLDSGTALVYDYYYKQWSTFTNHNAVGAVVFNSAYTFLTALGNILQETNNIYTDNGAPFFMSGTFGWLSFGGFQGFQRAYRLYFKGQYVTPHLLNISVAYDYNSNNTQTAVIDPSSLDNTTYGEDPFWGSTETWGGAAESEQWRINLDRQKCQSIQISFQETLDTSNPVYGAGLILEAIGVLIGVKSTYPRLSPTRIVS